MISGRLDVPRFVDDKAKSKLNNNSLKVSFEQSWEFHGTSADKARKDPPTILDVSYTSGIMNRSRKKTFSAL
jgi:hypothetical protein